MAGKCLDYELVKEGEDRTLRFDCEECSFFPSVEESEACMVAAINALIENPSATRIVFSQKRDYEYDYEQTSMLLEIAKVQSELSRQRIFYLDSSNQALFVRMKNIIYHKLKSDPVSAYYELRNMYNSESSKKDHSSIKMASLLSRVVKLMESSKLIAAARRLPYKYGERSIYRSIFKPVIKPDFMFTRLMSAFPLDGEEIDSYRVNGTEVTIFKLPGTVQNLYHVMPPEFRLSEDKYELLDEARSIISEHKPEKSEFIDPERMRQVFFNVGNDLLDELSEKKRLHLRTKELEELAEILVRYTIGFSLVEVLLQDEKIQDITINSPMGRLPAFVVHQEYDECMTNIIPTTNEGESWATKLRLMSGRPLDEANPILDTELVLPNVRARVAVVSSPLNPSGLAYAFRRHRDKPWTLPLFIKNGMITPAAAGLLSFLIDGARTMLVAGTRSAGKTSFLGAIMTEIMRKYRLITIEDSVAGESEVVIRRNGRFSRTTIGVLVDALVQKHGSWQNLSDHEITGNPEGVEMLAMDRKGKVRLSRVSKFIRHKVKKPLFEVRTRTGRTIKVTGDHALFTIGEGGRIVEAKVNELKKGSYVAVPRRLRWNCNDQASLNVLEKLQETEGCYIAGEAVEDFMIDNRKTITALCKELGIPKATRNFWMWRGMLPARLFKDLNGLGYSIRGTSLRLKVGKNSTKWLPANIVLDELFLTFVGLWIGDGCYDKNSVIISAVNEEDRQVVKEVAERFNMSMKMHSDGFSVMINSKTLKTIMRECFDLKGDSCTKRVPDWVYGLSENQIAWVLKGIFSSDGCVADKEIVIPLSSLNLLKDIQFLLSIYGVQLRIWKLRKDGTYNAGISSIESWLLFRDRIGILQRYKAQKLDRLCMKKSTHASTDVIPLLAADKEVMALELPNFNKNDYINRSNQVGRAKLSVLLQSANQKQEIVQNLELLANSDVFWDEVSAIAKLEHEGFVYDVSVPECESFVCDGVIAHNTLELPVAALKKMNYNIQSLKVAGALTHGTTEAGADEGIRSTLRLGDSGLIVGEVRSKEASALYEAMRVGALANVVAGTIHGDSPYGVFDRVVNDLGVPRTSFKATDIIVVANPIKSPDGLHRNRRITQITEVGKLWQQDPLLEKGFTDLMRYDSKIDRLEATPELMNGDSEVLKSVASNVKEWAGSWDAVWDNVMLRAKIKEAIVSASGKANKPELLEAEFVVAANDQFHRISDEIEDEIGSLDNKRIFFEWNEWLKKKIRSSAGQVVYK